MKHLLITLLLLAVAAAATCAISFRVAGDPKLEAALAHGDALEWMRTEFKLTDAQFAQIKELHEGYAVQCAEHCRLIQVAMRERDAAAENPAASQQAERRLQILRESCETAIAAHARRCAAVMSSASAARYLALVLPKIENFDHQAPPDVRLNHHRH